MSKKEHPFQIGTIPNPQMGCFDLQISVGNFKNRQEAQKYADRLVEFLRENTKSFEVARVQ